MIKKSTSKNKKIVPKKVVSKKGSPQKNSGVIVGKKERTIKAFLVSIVILQCCIIASSVYCSIYVVLNTNNKVLGAQTSSLISYASIYSRSRRSNGEKYRHDATSKYQTAGDSLGFGSADGGWSWSDCSRFVYAVMKKSGIDTSYPSSGAQTQLNYAIGKTSKYTIIAKIKQSDVKAGDIITIPNYHTGIAKTNGATEAYMASSGSQVPNLRGNASWMWGYSAGVTAIRLK